MWNDFLEQLAMAWATCANLGRAPENFENGRLLGKYGLNMAAFYEPAGGATATMQHKLTAILDSWFKQGAHYNYAQNQCENGSTGHPLYLAKIWTQDLSV